MKARDWLFGSVAVAAAAALLVPQEGRAEERRFTSPLIDTAGTDHIVYAPIVLKPLGPRPDSNVTGPAASWSNIDLFSSEFPDTGGRYRLLEIGVVCDPDYDEARPKIDISIAADAPMPENGPPPTIVLIDTTTGLQTQAVA